METSASERRIVIVIRIAGFLFLDPTKYVEKVVAAPSGLRRLTSGLGLMTMTDRARLLERGEPGIQLASDAQAHRLQFFDLLGSLLGADEFSKEVEHRAKLARGASGDIEERQQFLVGAAFKASCDVVRDRNRATLDLATKPRITRDKSRLRQSHDLDGKLDGRLPDGQVFELLVFHRRRRPPIPIDHRPSTIDHPATAQLPTNWA